MSCFLEISNLRKSYGDHNVLDGIYLTARRGEVVGIIGGNGAGKTTLLSILASLLNWNSGIVTINGQALGGKSSIKGAAVVSISSSQYGVFDYLTGRESVIAHGRLQHPTDHGIHSRADELLSVFDLEASSDQFVYEYSHGMKKKLSLACALVVVPDLLLLDEPFDGLDAVSVLRLLSIIRQSAEVGCTVLLTSHDLSIVEKICDRVAVIHDGMLKNEIKLVKECATDPSAATGGELQTALWEIIGKPQILPLSWLNRGKLRAEAPTD